MKASLRQAPSAQPKARATQLAPEPTRGAQRLPMEEDEHDGKLSSVLSERAQGPVQRRAAGDTGYEDVVGAAQGASHQGREGPTTERMALVGAAASAGTSGPGHRLPHLDTIQKSFGEHDVTGIVAHTDDRASNASRSIGALAFASGEHVVFNGFPSLFTAAHEAAHVIQQRAGVQLSTGVGQRGDRYEQHADEVATHVVSRQSAADLLPEPTEFPGRKSPTVQRRSSLGKGTDVGEAADVPPPTEDVFAGKSYDTTSKAGAMAFAQDWHTQLLRDYAPYMTPPGKAPSDLGISYVRAQRAGRAFFIYTAHYWPKLIAIGDQATPLAIIRATTDAVNRAHKEAETEEDSATRISPEDYRTLFPETFAKRYDVEASKLRDEGAAQFEEQEARKLDAARRKDRSTFIVFGTAQYRPNIAAKLHDAEAAKIRKGQWGVLRFEDHRLFFSLDGYKKGEELAAAEYDKYAARAENPDILWKEALESKLQGYAELDKQFKGGRNLSAAQQDLIALSVMASTMRNRAGRALLQSNVIDAWNEADQAMNVIRPAAVQGDVPASAKTDVIRVVVKFFQAFRDAVTGYDVEKTVSAGRGEGTYSYTYNPYFSSNLLSISIDWLKQAVDKRGWKIAFDRYNAVVAAMDNFIAAQLEKKGRKEEAEQLKLLAGRAGQLGNLIQEHKNAQKVSAIFYPRNELRNLGTAGAPAFAAAGIPLYFYLYRDEEEWNLVDVTTPHHLKVTSGSGGDVLHPDIAVFSKLNSKLRFPYGKIFYRLPDGSVRVLETTEPWRLSEWLTWIGLGIAAVGLAIVTAGGSLPATVIIVGAGVGVAAGVSDLLEKKRAGVLTTKDVVVDGLQIAGAVLGAGAAKLGHVVLSEAAAAGIAASEVGGLAGRLFVPVTLAAIGTDLSSFALLTADSVKALDAIDKQPGSDEDRKLAKLRVVAQLIGMGLITFVAVRSNFAGVSKAGAGLHLDIGPNGELSARPLLSDAELLEAAKRMKNSEEVTKLLRRDELAPELRDRIRAGLSEVLTTGPIALRKLEELLERLRAAVKPEEINVVLAELASRSRVGTICGGEVAARITAEESALLGHLDEATFAALKGASPRDLKTVASVLALDVQEGARLFREYGRDLIDYLRTNPLSGLDRLEDFLAKQRIQVTERVKGLYEGIDTSKPPEGGWKFLDKIVDEPGGTKVIRTTVMGPGGTAGYFERAYNPITRKLELRMAFLRSPKKKAVPGMIPKQVAGAEMIEGKGTPTLQYVTIYQMKRLGVPLGEVTAGVKTIHMSDIQNVETIVHLHWLRQRFPSNSLDELIEFTASVKYADTTAVQSGYGRTGRPSVSGGQDTPIRKLMSFQEDRKPERVAENKALLDKYGFTRETVMHWGFDIDFSVTPKLE